MRRFLKRFFKSLLLEIATAALVAGISKAKQEILESDLLKEEEKEAALVGANLVRDRILEEIEERL